MMRWNGRAVPQVRPDIPQKLVHSIAEGGAGQGKEEAGGGGGGGPTR